MSTNAESVVQAFLALPHDEQLAVAARVIELLPADEALPNMDDPDFIQELDRRFNDVEGAMTWEELDAESN